jgi:hypothetical protein
MTFGIEDERSWGEACREEPNNRCPNHTAYTSSSGIYRLEASSIARALHARDLVPRSDHKGTSKEGSHWMSGSSELRAQASVVVRTTCGYPASTGAVHVGVGSVCDKAQERARAPMRMHRSAG